MLETVYGTAKRLRWIKSHVSRNDRLVEVGCGTATAITIPMLQDGYEISGLDLDQASIAAAQEFLEDANLPRNHVQCMDVQDYDEVVDAIVISEVLEHMPDSELHKVLGVLQSALPPNGTLLVTIPNGFGWYEAEAWLWEKLGLERVFNWHPLAVVLYEIRMRLYGEEFDRFRGIPTSLSSSPHVQRFTRRKILRLLQEYNFEVHDFQGSILFSGPVSHALWSGCGIMMRLNHLLGRFAGRFASGFYIMATRRVD